MRPGHPIPLTLSVGKGFESLSIDNVSISPLLHLFHNLKNLYAGFSGKLPMEMGQLMDVLNTSPSLEALSRKWVARPSVSFQDDMQSKRVAMLPHLQSIFLAIPTTEEVMSIMNHLHIPSVASQLFYTGPGPIPPPSFPRRHKPSIQIHPKLPTVHSIGHGQDEWSPAGAW